VIVYKHTIKKQESCLKFLMTLVLIEAHRGTLSAITPFKG
jgi:hypothetical protein